MKPLPKAVTIVQKHNLILKRYDSEGFYKSTEVKSFETREQQSKAYFEESGKVKDGTGDYIVVSLDWTTLVIPVQ